MMEHSEAVMSEMGGSEKVFEVRATCKVENAEYSSRDLVDESYCRYAYDFKIHLGKKA